MTHAVYLTTPMNKRVRLEVERTGRGVYALRRAEGVDDLAHADLGFDLDDSSPEFVNEDHSSDAMSCFQRSTRLRGPELAVVPGEFHAASLIVLQENLNRLRGSFIDSQEY